MTRLTWDLLDERKIQYGIDQGVIYPREGTPVVWNGLVSIVENPDEADHEVSYYDGVSFVQRRSPEGFAASLSAFTYPEVLDLVNEFDLSYRVLSNLGSVIHLVYNVNLSPSNISYETFNSDVDSSTFDWVLTTVPEQIDTIRATAHVIIDILNTYPEIVQILEDLLYGTNEAPPRIPHLPELIDIFESMAILRIIDHGDGTWTATGPASTIEMLDTTTFKIISPSARYINSFTYKISSW